MWSGGIESMKTFTANVMEICDNGDAIVELPPDLLKEMGWKEGDTLDITEKDGKIYIKKLDNIHEGTLNENSR